MKSRSHIIKGLVYVLADNIDTDLIIPAKYLNLVPTIPAEYRELGSYALAGLPDDMPKYVKSGCFETEFPIIIAGKNFGCGSSREHAPISLGAAGTRVVIAESYARIFFRNCVATGELYPVESSSRLCDIFKTGDSAEIDIDTNIIKRVSTGESFKLMPTGAITPVIDAGGIFEYARQSGMIKK